MAGGAAFVIPDGKVVACDRCRTKTRSVKGESIDLRYSGKAHHHGANVQAVSLPGGFPIWISDAEPGSVPDITAARVSAFPALYRAASLGMPTLADPGYEGAGVGIKTPVKNPTNGRELDLDTRTANALLRSLRALGERAFALLTQRWRTLQHITATPAKSPRSPEPHSSSSTSSTATSIRPNANSVRSPHWIRRRSWKASRCSRNSGRGTC